RHGVSVRRREHLPRVLPDAGGRLREQPRAGPDAWRGPRGPRRSTSLGPHGRRSLPRAPLRDLGAERAIARCHRHHVRSSLRRSCREAMTVGVTGLGAYVPAGRMVSDEIATITGLPEWVVREKLGIHQRVLPGPDDHPTTMGVRAAAAALEQAGVD